MAAMILDCCANERTYQRDYGKLGERFSRLSSENLNACNMIDLPRSPRVSAQSLTIPVLVFSH